jgi:magnesium transporter
MPRTSYYLTDGDLRRDLDDAAIAEALRSGGGLLWLDLIAPTAEDGRFLETTFGFHHLAVEDCLSPRLHAPKVDDFGAHLFIVVHGVDHAAEDVVQTTEIGLFLGRNFVVTSHATRLYSVESVRATVEDDGRPMQHGADFLAHALIDALIDDILPTIDRMAEVAEEVQEEAIHHPQPSTLDTILRLNRSSLRVHRVMAPQREIVNRLARGEFPIISQQALIFYRDIYDHLVRIADLNQTIRDESNNALSTYLSSIAIQQNETTKILSAVASIFLPLTLVAGIYGMNFQHMPELTQPWAYFAVLGFMAVTIALSTWWFLTHGWIRVRPHPIVHVPRFGIDPGALLGHPRRSPADRPALASDDDARVDDQRQSAL